MKDNRKLLVTLGLGVGLLVAALDQTIVDTAFPRMIADLGGVSIFAWVITAYMLASTAFVPVVGKLADIYGRKVFYLGGLILFVGGSALCGASQNMGQLIAFRSLQGLGAGMLFPITLTIIGDMFPGPERAKMQGVFGGAFGLASIIGPKLGGWITHNFSWRWIFYVNLPVGLIAFLMILLAYRESRGERRPIDIWGAFTVTAGVVLLLLGLEQGGGDWGWSSPWTIGMFVLSALLLSFFVWIERRVNEPVLDLSLFGNRTFTTMSIVGFLMGAGLFGCIIYIPWFIQGVVGVDPNQAGNIMTPMMLTVVAFAFLGGQLAVRIPYRYQISAGFVLVGAGYVLMTRWSVATTQLTATLCSMVLGVGMGLLMPIITLAVQNAFPANRRGVVTSATTFFRQIGSTVGVSIFSVVFNHQMAVESKAVLGPIMAQVPPQALQAIPPEAMKMITEKPQSLIQLLIRPEAAAAVPAQFVGPLKEATRVMMSNSLHVVFWSGLAVAAVGILATQWLRNTSMKSQAAELGEPLVTHAPVMAE